MSRRGKHKKYLQPYDVVAQAHLYISIYALQLDKDIDFLVDYNRRDLFEIYSFT